ncbi:MAG: hypothetical protein JWL59_3285 [Chthoniobacteraceae bacterium]|nr:hypothetical protein [Chthoniobacteraceae bacterium]
MDLNLLVIPGMILGGLLAVIGTVMFMVAAFRQGILWGLGSLFVPFVSLIFVIAHWAEAKRGFLLSTVGSFMIIGAAFCSPDFIKTIAKEYPSLKSLAGKGEKAEDLTAAIQQKRDLLEQLVPELSATGANLARDFKELEARRKTLKSGDAEAITRFNEMAATYQSQNLRTKNLQIEIATANEDLNLLLAKRSKIQVVSPGGGKQIVMYTTASCGACKAAKQYFAQKGIRYEEFDVEQSRSAMAEFQRLGGRGVPLIIVGEKRLEGFSPQALEAIL